MHHYTYVSMETSFTSVHSLLHAAHKWWYPMMIRYRGGYADVWTQEHLSQLPSKPYLILWCEPMFLRRCAGCPSDFPNVNSLKPAYKCCMSIHPQSDFLSGSLTFNLKKASYNILRLALCLNRTLHHTKVLLLTLDYVTFLVDAFTTPPVPLKPLSWCVPNHPTVRPTVPAKIEASVGEALVVRSGVSTVG